MKERTYYETFFGALYDTEEECTKREKEFIEKNGTIKTLQDDIIKTANKLSDVDYIPQFEILTINWDEFKKKIENYIKSSQKMSRLK